VSRRKERRQLVVASLHEIRRLEGLTIQEIPRDTGDEASSESTASSTCITARALTSIVLAVKDDRLEGSHLRKRTCSSRSIEFFICPSA